MGANSIQIGGGIDSPAGVLGGVDTSGPNLSVVAWYFDDGGANILGDSVDAEFGWSGLLAPATGFPKTPYLNGFRELGVTFSRAYAASICGPCRGCVETGQHPFREEQTLGGNIEDEDLYAFGLEGHGLDEEGNINPDALSTITGLARAIRLGRNNTDDLSIGTVNFSYEIAWFGKDHLHKNTGFEDYAVKQFYGRYKGCQPNVPGVFDNGVDDPDNAGGHFHFLEVFHTSGTTPTIVQVGEGMAWVLGGADFVAYQAGTPKRGWDAYLNIRDAILWINSRTRPVFLKMCLNPPHKFFEVPPYECPDDVGHGATMGTWSLLSQETRDVMTALDGGGKGPGYRPTDPASVIKVYKAMVEAVDSLMGLFYARINQSVSDNLMTFFFGDNGTVADVVEAPYDPNKSKRTIWEGGIRVPLVVWGGSNQITSPGRTCDHLVHVVDFYTTILKLVKADPLLYNPEERVLDGIDFSRVLKDPEAEPARDFIYNEIFLPNGAWAYGTGDEAINLAVWVKCYIDGTYKLIKWQTGAPVPYSFYNITHDLQGSGNPGYMENSADDLYATVLSGSNPTLTARFNTLLAAMNTYVATANPSA